jgi:hypothetical protein
MHGHSTSNEIQAIERRVLRALCGGEFVPPAESSLWRDLNSYAWSDPEHRIVYEALTRIPPREALSYRELLPAQATRMGFPDVDWPQYFEPDAKPGAELRVLVQELVAASAERR